MPISLITCLALAALVEAIVFSAYCSTLEEGDGCCYPGYASLAGSPPPSVPRRSRSRRHRRGHNDITRHRAHSSGENRQPEGATTATTQTAPAANTTHQGVGGNDSGVGGSSSSSAATLIPSSEGDSCSHSSSSSSGSGSGSSDGPALRRGHGYSLRQRIVRAQRSRW